MYKYLLTAAFAVSSIALATDFNIDPDHANAGFTVKHLGITNVTGTLGTVTGTVSLDEKDVTKSKATASIDPNAIYTGVAKRDGHLKSGDFFDIEKFKAVTFTSTKWEKAGDKLKITGDLTMHGITKSVTLDAEIGGEATNPWSKKLTRTLAASTVINRHDFGLNWNGAIETVKVVGDDVKVNLDIEIIKADAPAAKPAAAAPAKK